MLRKSRISDADFFVNDFHWKEGKRTCGGRAPLFIPGKQNREVGTRGEPAAGRSAQA